MNENKATRNMERYALLYGQTDGSVDDYHDGDDNGGIYETKSNETKRKEMERNG